MAPTIKKLLAKEGLTASSVSVHNFLKKYAEAGTVHRRFGSGRPLKLTPEVKDLVERQMCKDHETTAHQLHTILQEADYSISQRFLRCRTALGWTFQGTSYCQTIRETNKQKHLEWACQHLHEASKT